MFWIKDSYNSGYIESKPLSTDHIFKISEEKSMELPITYSLQPFMPEVIDQKEDNICVPCALSTFINWKLNISDGHVYNNHVDLFDIFKHRKNKSENGMEIRDSLSYASHEGIKTDQGRIKISQYARVGGVLSLKYAIIMNGPCIASLPVYNSNLSEFWMDDYVLKGGHAVSIIGWDENGFIIRNSWGKRYGSDGYYTIKYKDFNKFIEIWTIIG